MIIYIILISSVVYWTLFIIRCVVVHVILRCCVHAHDAYVPFFQILFTQAQMLHVVRFIRHYIY